MSKANMIRSLIGATALALSSTAALAQPVAMSTLPASAAVSSVYARHTLPPMWFKGGAATPAVAQLVAILQRAPFDGFAAGPQLAAQVEASAAQARSGNPQAVAAAEQMLSSAWVSYVQSIKRPTQGMHYIYPMLQPQGNRPDQILLTAAAAPSLTAHMVAASNVNSVYAQLRDAAWAQAQASGSLVPDARLLANLDRARTIPGTGRFAVVDIAGQYLTMFENGRPVDTMKVIVGTSKYPTPMIASYIHYVTMNPYWDSPDHLVKEAIAPNVIRQGFGYLKSRGYEVMADWSPTAAVVSPDKVDWKAVASGKTQVRIRQKPGPSNFMATMKIPFQNDDDIYLHDTPAKDLFAKSQRALSNGCIRLEDAPRFARWLLNGHDAVAPNAEPEAHIKIAQGVPIYITYLTAQARDGKVTYAADVYGMDKQTARAASN